MNKIKLYIVKQNENLAEIADKFNTSKEEIIRYNPSLRYKNVYKGQPLNILIRESEEVVNLDIRPQETRSNTEDQSSVRLGLMKYSYALKDCLQIKVIYPKGLKSYKEELDSVLSSLRNETEKFGNKFVNSLSSFADTLIDFADSIYRKDIVSLKEGLNRMKRDGTDLLEASQRSPEDIESRNIVDSVVELWRDLVLALAELDFRKVINKFKEILRFYDNLLERLN